MDATFILIINSHEILLADTQ